MEAILGPDSKPFETFLSDHKKNDPEAKAMFEAMKQTDPDCLSLKLINYLCPDSNHHLNFREECAELLRKLITDDDDLCTWHKLSFSTQSSLKCILLECMNPEEESKFIIQELRETVSKLAASLLPHNNWLELLPFLYQCVNTSGSNNYLRMSAFWVFRDLVKDIGEAVAPTWHPLFHNAQMEAILGSDSELFENFLYDHRSDVPEAELMFKAMKQTDPDCLSLKLISYICPDSHHCIYFREDCANLLRKLIIDDDDLCTWRKLSVSTLSSLKCTLLECLNPEEESEFIIQELRETVSKLAASLLPHNAWPELMPFLYQCINTSGSNNYLRESAFWIFGELVKDIGKAVAPCIKTWHPLFLKALNNDTLCLGVRMAATTAVIYFIQCVPDSNEKERFQYLLPGMLSTVTDPLSNSDAANEVLEHFILLAKNEPRFLRMQLREVVNTMFDVAEADSFQEEMRHSAIEVLITLVEAKERAPGMMKRLPLFVSRFFALLINLLLDFKDCPAWHDLSQSTEFSSSFLVGENCLKRLSIALGGKSIAHIAKEQLSPYLASPEWEKRHAALRALGCVAKGWSQPQVQIKNIGQVANVVLNCLKYPHPLVRYAACRTIIKFMKNNARFQEQYRNRILLALAAAIDDVHPRVQNFAMKALVCFCCGDRSETLIPNVDEIVMKLLELLQNDKDMVQHQALSTMAYIAHSAMERFLPYYDTVMLHMKNVLKNADLNSNLILRTIALEFISYVGEVVGQEKFRDEAKQVMEYLMSLQGLQGTADDPTTSFLLRVCMRVCNCIGKDFLPYMSTVMPILIQCAQLEPVSTVCAKPKLNNRVYGLGFICIEDVNYPDVLEAKVRACQSLYAIANALKEDFYPWIPQAVSTFVSLRTRCTSNYIRKSAIEAMPVLLRSAELAVEKGIAQGESESYFKELSDYIIIFLVEALHKAHVEEMCALMLEELNNCLQICQPLLNEGHLRRLVDTVKHVITESSNRKRKLKERAKFEDYDAEEDELLWKEREQEDEIVGYVGHLLVTLIKTFKAAFLPLFDELSPYLIPMWGKDMTAHERITSSFIFDNILIQCPEAALKYFDIFVPLLLDASNDETPLVRQNAFYGLRLCVEYGGSIFKPFVGEALSRINVVITHLHAREPENESAYDNAVSLLSNICQVHRESIDSVHIIPAWLNCLPIKSDLFEAKLVHDQLCSMVERSDREFLGPNYLYLPKVISVFAEVLCARGDLATEDTVKRMINLLRDFQQSLPQATWASAQLLLLPQQEMELASIISPEEDINI